MSDINATVESITAVSNYNQLIASLTNEMIPMLQAQLTEAQAQLADLLANPVYLVAM